MASQSVAQRDISPQEHSHQEVDTTASEHKHQPAVANFEAIAAEYNMVTAKGQQGFRASIAKHTSSDAGEAPAMVLLSSC